MFCLAMRRETYARLGPLDERYEVGLLEDDDYAERARRAGCQMRCVEDVLVHHFGEASFGKLVGDGEHARILQANRRRYAEKWNREWEPYGRRPNPRYERDAQKLREAVERAAPVGSTVLVVSRGDDALLQLDGRRGLHFPQTREGGWAGHHPADSEEAICHLEQLRGEGAEYLAIPSTYRWWLEHYRDLRGHLDRHYQTVLWQEEGCVVYRLEPTVPSAEAIVSLGQPIVSPAKSTVSPAEPTVSAANPSDLVGVARERGCAARPKALT